MKILANEHVENAKTEQATHNNSEGALSSIVKETWGKPGSNAAVTNAIGGDLEHSKTGKDGKPNLAEEKEAYLAKLKEGKSEGKAEKPNPDAEKEAYLAKLKGGKPEGKAGKAEKPNADAEKEAYLAKLKEGKPEGKGSADTVADQQVKGKPGIHGEIGNEEIHFDKFKGKGQKPDPAAEKEAYLQKMKAAKGGDLATHISEGTPESIKKDWKDSSNLKASLKKDAGFELPQMTIVGI